MGFNTSLSGLNAASSDLDVTSNNIANVGTAGFKQSRAEFADIFAANSLISSKTQIGSGVQLNAVTQQFAQGNLEFTNNTLDLAISGEGFFVLTPNLTSGDRIFTRAGAFQLDASGNLVNNIGQVLQGFPVDPATGVPTTTSLASAQPITAVQTSGTPSATTLVQMGVNLDANGAALGVAGFNPVIPATFNHTTSLTVFDSLGNSHLVSTYFIKENALTNTWETRSFLDGTIALTTGADDEILDFTQAGTLDTTGGFDAIINFDAIPAATLANGAADLTLVLNFAATGNTTQFSSPFVVNSITQDGFSTGRLSGLDISSTGIVTANFSNGQVLNLAKIALGQFGNPQGLRQLGDTTWGESIDSGLPIGGEAETGTFGSIFAGALEASNVDITEQLVKLITAQRNFQANSKAIETANNVTQTIINIG